MATLQQQIPLSFDAPVEDTFPFRLAEDASHYVVRRPVSGDELIAFSLEILAKRFQRGEALTSVADAKAFFVHQLAEREHEVFACAFLDNRHRVIAYDEMFFGTIDGATVYPRVVVKKALDYNAAAVMLVHNHPSTVAEPSQADEQITRRLKDALALVDIRVLDHFVVGGAETVSFAERGLL